MKKLLQTETSLDIKKMRANHSLGIYKQRTNSKNQLDLIPAGHLLEADYLGVTVPVRCRDYLIFKSPMAFEWRDMVMTPLDLKREGVAYKGGASRLPKTSVAVKLGGDEVYYIGLNAGLTRLLRTVPECAVLGICQMMEPPRHYHEMWARPVPTSLPFEWAKRYATFVSRPVNCDSCDPNIPYVSIGIYCGSRITNFIEWAIRC